MYENNTLKPTKNLKSWGEEREIKDNRGSKFD
jgi:hypothetical protein